MLDKEEGKRLLLLVEEPKPPPLRFPLKVSWPFICEKTKGAACSLVSVGGIKPEAHTCLGELCFKRGPN
jgi:hypothetical protein